jgi:hypothetical protein
MVGSNRTMRLRPRGLKRSRLFGTRAPRSAFGTRRWGLQPAAGARVYEIRLTGDWQALVSRYPRLVEPGRFGWNNCYAAFPGPFDLPAWDRVAVDWDAVRFTLSGLIYNNFALVEVLDGYTMLIDEETGEQTIWLRGGFEAVEDLGDAGDSLIAGSDQPLHIPCRSGVQSHPCHDRLPDIPAEEG